MNLTDEQVAHEVAQIMNEEQWPNWPWLPLKNVNRYDGDAKWADQNGGLGMLMSPSWVAKAEGRTGVQVLLVNMLHLSKALEAQLDVGHLDFASIEDMVRAGWIGD